MEGMGSLGEAAGLLGHPGWAQRGGQSGSLAQEPTSTQRTTAPQPRSEPSSLQSPSITSRARVGTAPARELSKAKSRKTIKSSAGS